MRERRTCGEADDPNVEEVEVGDARPGLVDLVQTAPGAPLAVLPPPRRQQWRRRAAVLAAAGHPSLSLSLSLLVLAERETESGEQVLVNEGKDAKANTPFYNGPANASSVTYTCGLR